MLRLRAAPAYYAAAEYMLRESAPLKVDCRRLLRRIRTAFCLFFAIIFQPSCAAAFAPRWRR